MVHYLQNSIITSVNWSLESESYISVVNHKRSFLPVLLTSCLVDDEQAQLALMLRLGLLRETRMNAPEAAIEIYREVLERDASNADALVALERLLVHPEYQGQIAEILVNKFMEKLHI